MYSRFGSEDRALERVEQRPLALDQLAPRGRHVEPGGAVDLGELADHAGARRPLELEGGAPHGVGVEVGFDGPRRHALATRLADGAEVERRAGRRLAARLLAELAASRGERVLAVLVFA